MATILSSLLRSAARQVGEPLNILTFPTHERYETGLCKTGHNFYSWRARGIKDWNRTFAPVPENYTLLNAGKGEDQAPPDVVFDLILSQNRLGFPASQFAIADSLSRSLHVPHVALEHTLPHPEWGTGRILRLRQMKADYNVFISNYSRDAWMWGENEALVVHHGIDTEMFRPPAEDAVRRPVLLSVVNDWINRDWCCGFEFWKQTTDGLPCFVVGDTPGLSKPAATTDELVWRYQQASIFVNTSTVSPVPTSLLEAMACGCAVVSTDNCMIPDIIQNGVNGYRTNDQRWMRAILEKLLSSPEECRRLGQAARRTIQDKFSMTAFKLVWNSVFRAASDSLPQVRGPRGEAIVTEYEVPPSGFTRRP